MECSPKRDHGPPGPYFQLRKLKKRQGTNPFVKGAPFTTVLTLVNKKGQSFHIYVSAGSAFAVQRFIAATSACV